MALVKEIIKIDRERIEREYKKVRKKIKDFDSDYIAFKATIIKKESLVENNTYRKIQNTGCDKKIYWKVYIRDKDKKYQRLGRIIFFIKDKILYIIEIYHKDNKNNPEKKNFKNYCDF